MSLMLLLYFLEENEKASVRRNVVFASGDYGLADLTIYAGKDTFTAGNKLVNQLFEKTMLFTAYEIH